MPEQARKPGNSRLVYNKKTRSIDAVKRGVGQAPNVSLQLAETGRVDLWVKPWAFYYNAEGRELRVELSNLEQARELRVALDSFLDFHKQ